MFTVNSPTENSRVQIKSINSQSEWIEAQNCMSCGGLLDSLAKRYLFINAVNVAIWVYGIYNLMWFPPRVMADLR